MLSSLKEYWLQFAEILNKIMSTLIFTVIYIVGIGLYAIAFRLKQITKITEKKEAFWLAKEQKPWTLEMARRQF